MSRSLFGKMNFTQCRALILQRLHERDKRTAQFERFFRQYEKLADQLLHQVARSNRILAAGSKGRSLSAEGSSGELEHQLESVRQELAELYKTKAQNDQQLIDANNRLGDVERQHRSAQLERDTALKKIDALKQELELANVEAHRLKEDNQCLLDEHIALQAAYNAMEAKYIKADQERSELIVRLKELKEKEISLVNEMNERELQLQLQKIRSQLADASRPNPMLDAKAYEVVSLDEVPDIASPSSGGKRERMQSYGDAIPDRCRIKFECNDMGEVNDVLFNPNGKFFFTAGMDKKVKMWTQDHDSYTKKAEFTGANQGITRLDLDPECRHILASSNDFAVRVWSIDDQRLRFTFTGHSDKVTTARFFNGGRSVASGSNDRTIKLWDIAANRCQKTFFPASTVTDIVTNEKGFGLPLISSHFDKNVRFWDIRLGDSPANILNMGTRVTSLCVTADCQSLLCSARDETLTLIDLRNYGTMHIYSAEQYRTSSDFNRAVISPADTYVAAGSADGNIFVWNLVTTRLEKVLYKGGHEGAAVLALSWHPGGHMLISGDRRRTVCLWR